MHQLIRGIVDEAIIAHEHYVTTEFFRCCVLFKIHLLLDSPQIHRLLDYIVVIVKLHSFHINRVQECPIKAFALLRNDKLLDQFCTELHRFIEFSFETRFELGVVNRRRPLLDWSELSFWHLLLGRRTLVFVKACGCIGLSLYSFLKIKLLYKPYHNNSYPFVLISGIAFQLYNSNGRRTVRETTSCRRLTTG